MTVFSGPDLTSRQIETADEGPVKTQSEFAVAWKSLIPEFPTDDVHVLPSIEHAIRVVRGIQSKVEEGEVDVLVAGSLHLVGGVIEVAGLADVAL
jgi:folylpolyglutamate synthase